jgi:hypothetical protein
MQPRLSFVRAQLRVTCCEHGPAASGVHRTSADCPGLAEIGRPRSLQSAAYCFLARGSLLVVLETLYNGLVSVLHARWQDVIGPKLFDDRAYLLL